MGWKSKPLGMVMTAGRRSRRRNILSMRSWNWVALRMVHGTVERSITLSASSFTRKYG